MKRVWKNIVCGTGLVQHAGTAEATRMDIIGAQPAYRQEERDWSFGGFDQDDAFFHDPESGFDPEYESRRHYDQHDHGDRYDEDSNRRFFEGDFSLDEDDRSENRRDRKQDTALDEDSQSAATQDDTDSEQDTEDSSRENRDNDKAKSTAMQLMQAPGTDEEAAMRMNIRWYDEDPRQPVNGYGLFVFLLELAALVLLSVWMIVSKANSLTWKQVMSSHQTELPAIPAAATGTMAETTAAETGKEQETAADTRKAAADQDEPVETIEVEEVTADSAGEHSGAEKQPEDASSTEDKTAE